ncbi:hypothetical protein GCM10018954_036100 [Kutzneria kofuensis]
MVSGKRTVRLITVSNTVSPKRLDDARHDLPRVQRARVVHGGEDARDLKLGVQPFLDLLDGVDQQRDAAQAEELALQWD